MIKKIVFNRYSLLLAAIIIILGISYYLFFPQFEVCVLGKRVFFSRFQAKQSITVPSGISQISITSSILCKEERTGSTGSEFLIPIGSVVKLSVGKKRYQLNFVSVKTLSEGYLFLKSDFTLNSLCRGKNRALVLIGTNEQNILTVYTFLNSHINMIALSNAPKDINNIVSCYDDKSTYIAYNSVVDKKVYVVKLEKNRLEIIFSLPSEYVTSLSLTPMKKGVALSVSDSINNFKNSVYQIYSSKSINISSLSMGSVVGSTLLGSENYLYQLGLTENSGYGAVIEQFQNN
ncbi:MAG: hypothetical protein NTX05_00185, partial [Fusobacteria bacterium]|nr:hypothetical protein [Fusobacteriota bacterium]